MSLSSCFAFFDLCCSLVGCALGGNTTEGVPFLVDPSIMKSSESGSRFLFLFFCFDRLESVRKAAEEARGAVLGVTEMAGIDGCEDGTTAVEPDGLATIDDPFV